ncbi:substrate-binding periplasmic protein [Massilia cavernae]|nr:hypothetical protein [Massilia cavernae]
MRFVLTLSTLALLAAAGQASAACTPMLFGYMDQHRPPYYHGTGPEESRPRGAGIDLVHEIAASANCPLRTTRLPLARLRAAAQLGVLDAIPLEATQADLENYALPVDARGKLDPAKALRLHIVVYVRAGDAILKDAEPAQALRQRRLGINHAVPMVAPLRNLGFKIDDGGVNPARNLEKLVRNRIDGYAVSVSALGDMDAWVARNFGKAVMRLDKPIVTHHIWVAVNKDYFARNRPHVETMWNWLAENGQGRFSKLIKKYEKQSAASGI